MNFPGLNANEQTYRTWRAYKLRATGPLTAVPLAGPLPSATEARAIWRQTRRRNMAVFALTDPARFSRADLRALGRRLGLNRLDKNLHADESGVSELRAVRHGRRGEYIPYSNRALGWHSDGYYNPPEKTIRAFILYCRQDAANGGVNRLLDPELAYIHLRDAGRGYIEALARPDTLTIPPTIEDGKLIRPAFSGAVLSEDAASGALHIRYTQRKTHIRWRGDNTTRQALEILADLLAGQSGLVVALRLAPGQGLVCNNVLHNRSAFVDAPRRPRIIYRARYYERLPCG